MTDAAIITTSADEPSKVQLTNISLYMIFQAGNIGIRRHVSTACCDFKPLSRYHKGFFLGLHIYAQVPSNEGGVLRGSNFHLTHAVTPKNSINVPLTSPDHEVIPRAWFPTRDCGTSKRDCDWI